MPVTAALISAGATGLSLGTAAVQNSRAKKIAKANVRPDYVPSQQIQENRDLAASLSGTGLPDSTRVNAEQSAERNLSQSLNAILRSGSDGNQIADLYGANSDAMLKLAGADAELQRFNISQYLGANAALGGEKQSAWQVNEFAPYNNNAQLAAQLRANAVQNASNGINQGISGANNYALANLYKKNADKKATSSDPNSDGLLGAFNSANSFVEDNNAKSLIKNDMLSLYDHYAWYDSKVNRSAQFDGLKNIDAAPSQRYLKSSIRAGYDSAYQDLIDNAYKTNW
jgi:hypothetical protein